MGLNDREDRSMRTADKLYNAKIAAAVSAPTAITDGYATNVAANKGPRYVNFRGTIRNAADTAEGTTKIVVTPYFYDPNAPGTLKWIPAAKIAIWLVSEIVADTAYVKGNHYQIVKPSGCTRVAWATDAAPAAGNVLHLAVELDT
jgi:hypothetical protein